MRHRVTLQSLSQTPDAYGQLADTWTALGTYWAFVRTPSGREALIAKQLKAELTHVVAMRWLSGATPTDGMSLSFNGRTLNILYVINIDERQKLLEIHCQEIEVEPDALPPG